MPLFSNSRYTSLFTLCAMSVAVLPFYRICTSKVHNVRSQELVGSCTIRSCWYTVVLIPSCTQGLYGQNEHSLQNDCFSALFPGFPGQEPGNLVKSLSEIQTPLKDCVILLPHDRCCYLEDRIRYA